MKLKNRHWYNFGEQYQRAEFVVKIIIGAADLKFQLLGKTGTISKEHEEIEVQWTAPASPQVSSVRAEEVHGMYRGPY